MVQESEIAEATYRAEVEEAQIVYRESALEAREAYVSARDAYELALAKATRVRDEAIAEAFARKANS